MPPINQTMRYHEMADPQTQPRFIGGLTGIRSAAKLFEVLCVLAAARKQREALAGRLVASLQCQQPGL